MKKTILLLFAAASSFAVQAQHRNCGTMQYHEHRKSVNPALGKIMEGHEALIKSKTIEPVALPYLPGFTATGNAESDQLAYRIAKINFLAAHPHTPKKQPGQSELNRLRDEKRKRNHIH
jgi:hypothetical protein